MKEIHGDVEIDKDDLPFEEEILRHPYNVRSWLRYIEHKIQKRSTHSVVNLVCERALKQLPGSYKIWNFYLMKRRNQVKKKSIIDPAIEECNNAHERALVFMNKMPRIWVDYCQFLMQQAQITRTRHLFDRALKSLPITQHHIIWPHYLEFVNMYNLPELSKRVYRRYLKLNPEDAELYIDYLISIENYDEAAAWYIELLNRGNFISKHGKSHHLMWYDLCEIITKNPDKIKTVEVASIIRSALKKFTDGLGILWCSLAQYYIRSGLFEIARDVFEEGINSVLTVKDFGQIFDAYSQFEESSLNILMKKVNINPNNDDNLETEIRLARLEYLMDRRPFLLNNVLIRQNPHNVDEWLKRAKLYEAQYDKVIETYLEAIKTVDPKLATGKSYQLWIEFSKHYEKNVQYDKAINVYKNAIHVPFKNVEDLTNVWCNFAEYYIRHDEYEKALETIKLATSGSYTTLKISYNDENETVQRRVHKSLKLWLMYADLEENVGSFEGAKAVFNRIIELKIATPQVILNYATFLEENNYFEESFKAYEKGISIFTWPHVNEIWQTYITKFLNRYNGEKMERFRDLFEQLIETCPVKFAKPFYLMYGKLEEQYGLARHAMTIYDRATKVLPQDDKFEMYCVYIRRCAELFGVTHCRKIYEKAIEELNDDHSREMCMRYADLERKLGEIDRARSIYGYCSQLCDPRTHQSFWTIWNDFEVQHGNEDTFREMLHIKRSVQALHNTQVDFVNAQIQAAKAIAEKDSMAKLEEQVMAFQTISDQIEHIPSADSIKTTFKSISFVRGEEQTSQVNDIKNPEEINLDATDNQSDDKNSNESGDQDINQEDFDVDIQKKDIPREVFGSLRR